MIILKFNQILKFLKDFFIMNKQSIYSIAYMELGFCLLTGCFFAYFEKDILEIVFARHAEHNFIIKYLITFYPTLLVVKYFCFVCLPKFTIREIIRILFIKDEPPQGPKKPRRLKLPNLSRPKLEIAWQK